ncbi:SpoIIE family protein phosphatase [Streptomyces fructofermentans]|uniref:SpoIIE family protein phosphatase n=1 Tax=Streptomyces fructofermentans TaxID=152141 RepID=UPI0033F8A1DE
MSSSSDDALLVVDGAGIVREWSDEARRVLGRTASEVVGRPAGAVMSGILASSDREAVARTRAVLTNGLLLLPLALPDGSGGWGVYRAPLNGVPDPVGLALLEALFTLSPIGMQVVDPELRVMRVNTATKGMSGLHDADIVGHRLTDVARLTAPEATDAMLRDVMASGEPAIDQLLGARPPSDPDREHLYSVSILPLRDSAGRTLGAATSVVDVTEHERALARTRLLNTTRENVGRTLEMDTTCAEFVRVLVPDFADDVELDLLDSVVRGDEPPSAPIARDMPLRRIASASGDRLHESPGAHSGPVRFPAAWLESLDDLQPHLVTYRPPPVARLDIPLSDSGPAGDPYSAIVAPLTLRGGVLGTLSLYRSPGRPRFEAEDLDLTRELAARAALHIDNSRRYTREHTIAVTLHRYLLPENPPDPAAVETAHYHRPTRASGGWFDVIPLSGARVALTMGRVSGAGIHSTTAMGQLRTAIRTLSSLDLECDELLAQLNDTVIRLAAERAALSIGRSPQEEPLTARCAYGIYDPLTLNLTIGLAGHPPPVLALPDGTTEVPDIAQAPPLGSDDDGAVFASTRLGLEAGTVIGLHTDAFQPADTGAQAHLDPLRRILAAPGLSLDAMRDEAARLATPEEPDADAILLLARTRALGSDQFATWDLPADPAAVAEARRQVRSQLEAWHLDALIWDAELVVSELATNAVRHGTPPFTLRLIRSRTLTCEVSDSSPVSPNLRHAQAGDEGGRGLFICAELAQRWGARFTSAGKTIWTELELPGGAPAR